MFLLWKKNNKKTNKHQNNRFSSVSSGSAAEKSYFLSRVKVWARFYVHAGNLSSLIQIFKQRGRINRFGLVWFYGTSTIVSYLMPNPFLYIWTVLFQTIQFSIRRRFQCQRAVLFQTIQFRVSIVFCLHSSKTVLFRAIQFSISTHIQCQKQFYFKQFSLALLSLVLFDQ